MKESTTNSTIIPLVSGETFSGRWERTIFPELMVSCICDSPANIFIDLSVDQINYTTEPTIAVTSGVTLIKVVFKGLRYCRVRITAGGTQTYLRLNTYYGSFHKLWSTSAELQEAANASLASINTKLTNPLPVSFSSGSANPSYLLFIPKQAVGANKVFFDLFNATGSGKLIKIKSIVPVVSGAVAVTGVLGIDLFLTRTSAIGTGGTAATSEGTSLTAATFSKAATTSANLPAQITARLTPAGGATAGAVILQATVFTEETNAATYLSNIITFLSDITISENSGIRIVQGAVASVGNIGYNILLETQ